LHPHFIIRLFISRANAERTNGKRYLTSFLVLTRGPSNRDLTFHSFANTRTNTITPRLKLDSKREDERHQD
jgi:hypothetical protein